MQRQLTIVAATALLLLPLGIYGRLHWLRPARTSVSTQTLFPGIAYRREARSQPRPVMMQIVTIDLQTAGIKALVTPRKSTTARTTSEFVRDFKVKLAINASYFNPFHEHTPWDYYPRTGDLAEAIGEVIANGDRYALPLKKWAVLCISQGNIAQIAAAGTCPQGTLNAVAGRELLVRDGQPTAEIRSSTSDDKPYPRVAVGINRLGNKLWLIVVDGKQPLYSEGVTKIELAEIFAALKVDRAVNLDGGGSTTLVIATANGTQVLNAPIHAKLPMNERPVANHLGFYSLP